MDGFILIGRIVFAIMFVGSGMGHLMQADSSTQYAESKGLPQARNAVLLSGVCLLAGGIAVILGIWIDLAVLLLAILVFIIGVLLHPFWKLEGMEQQNEMSMFMKNLTITGACLVMFGLFGGGYSENMLVDPIGLL